MAFEAALRIQMKEVIYVYVGSLPDGEAYDGELLSIEEVSDGCCSGLAWLALTNFDWPANGRHFSLYWRLTPLLPSCSGAREG